MLFNKTEETNPGRNGKNNSILRRNTSVPSSIQFKSAGLLRHMETPHPMMRSQSFLNFNNRVSMNLLETL